MSIIGRLSNTLLWSTQLGLVVLIIGAMISVDIANNNEYKFRPENFGFDVRDFPPDQGLRLRKRIGSKKGACESLESSGNTYFTDLGGVYCNEHLFDAKPEDDGTESKEMSLEWGLPVERQLRQVHALHQTFDTVANAKAYHTQFWGLTLPNQVVPLYIMQDVTNTVPNANIGDKPHLLLWDPSQMAWSLPVAAPDQAYAKHIVFAFRVDRTVVRLSVEGHHKHLAPEITPGFLVRLGMKLKARIRANSPSKRLLALRAMENELGLARKVYQLEKILTNTVDRAWEGLEHASDLVTNSMMTVRASLHDIMDKYEDQSSSSVLYGKTSFDSSSGSSNDQYGDANLTTDEDEEGVMMDDLDAAGTMEQLEYLHHYSASDDMIWGLVRLGAMIFTLLTIIGTCESLEARKKKKLQMAAQADHLAERHTIAA